MKCQECNQPATHHVTEIVAGEAVEYHVCDTHLGQLQGLNPAPKPKATSITSFLFDPELRTALQEADGRQKMAAHLLPALCLALQDARPETKILAAFHLARMGQNASSAAGALRDATQDSDTRVRKAAELALECLEDQEPQHWPW